MASPTCEPFERAYKVGHVLGKGGFGVGYAGVRNRDGLQVAIKHIAKAKIKDWGQVGAIIYSIEEQIRLLLLLNVCSGHHPSAINERERLHDLRLMSKQSRKEEGGNGTGGNFI